MNKLWLSLLALAACGSGSATTLQISDYNTACTSASSCAAVFVGDPCASACKCPNAAIDNRDTIREASDLAAAEALCTSPPPGCTESCSMPQATCTLGVCALQ
jgi:hypothetical protein